MGISLIIAFLLIGLLSFGGGYAAIPIMESELVNRFHLLTPEQLYHYITLAQVVPGPLSINASTMSGYSVGGFSFALLATCTLLIPPTIITLLLVTLWEQWRHQSIAQNFIAGLKPAVVALVAAAGISMASRSVHDGPTFLILLISTLAAYRWRQQPLAFIGVSLAISLAYALVRAYS